MQKIATGSSLTFVFIPSKKPQYLGSCLVRNKSTNKETTFVKGVGVDYYEHSYYVEADVTLTVTEGQRLELIVYDEDGVEAYVGNVFVTDQEAFTFDNTEWDKYTQNSSDNEYIEP